MNQASTIYKEDSMPHGAMLTLDEAPIQQDPEKLGGHPTIGAKRVQADVLINYLAAGRTIQDFLDDYDAVTQEEVLAVLSVIKQAILDGALTNIQVREVGADHLSTALERMRAEGLIAERRQPAEEISAEFKRIKVSGGKAVSETIIEERR